MARKQKNESHVKEAFILASFCTLIVAGTVFLIR